MGERTVSKAAPFASVGPSWMPGGMREKLVVAFSLTSVLPLLVLAYVVANYVLPRLQTRWDLYLVVGLTAGITLLGFLVIRGLVLPVIKLSQRAQAIAAGYLVPEMEVRTPDEIGALGVALNQITQKVHENVAQLKVCGEETRQLNLEINRRILTLSDLLQVSNLVSQSAGVEEVLTFILEKLTQLEEAQLNCLLELDEKENSFIVRAASGMNQAQAQVQMLLHSQWVAPGFKKILKERQVFVIDHRSTHSQEQEMLKQLFGMTNAVCQPLTLTGGKGGILICANQKEGFTFGEDALELFKIFAKLAAISIENDLLLKRAKTLEITDELTGLYNEKYMRNRLEEEIRRAIRYHRPCSLVLLNLDSFRELQDLCGGLASEGILRQVADPLKPQVSEVDRVGRIGLDEFMMVLPERNKREAIELAEGIRRRIESDSFANGGMSSLPRPLTISAGISENPLDGSTSEELLIKATDALKLAKVQGKNRVVAT